MTKNVLIDNLLEPLNGETTAKFDINAGDGNLIIDQIVDGEQVLASGELQYFEKQGLPVRNAVSINGQTILTLKGGGAGQPWFRFPWAACNGATEWRLHLNPTVPSDISAHSDGGNVSLDLAGISITHVSADTGGGNVYVVLPGKVIDLNVTARTGAGNVVVHIPSNVAARIHATVGLGKVIMDSRFSKIDDSTYQSSDYDGAANKVEVTVSSGAGNVSITTE
ncbi:hypothetical protein ANAEL_04819 [Anaerolineales bacterium]|nr:hypothetical protein ANAEL_04819 [Anaerolineales bacterium]